MHYKNKREVKVGDWIVGPTHNSENKVVCGIVLELMPQQGPCNVRLLTFPSYRFFAARPADYDDGGITVYTGDKNTGVLGYQQDFADAAECGIGPLSLKSIPQRTPTLSHNGPMTRRWGEGAQPRGKKSPTSYQTK
jgi:hypothetical protein